MTTTTETMNSTNVKKIQTLQLIQLPVVYIITFLMLFRPGEQILLFILVIMVFFLIIHRFVNATIQRDYTTNQKIILKIRNLI